jgi:hypothetical protein
MKLTDEQREAIEHSIHILENSRKINQDFINLHERYKFYPFNERVEKAKKRINNINRNIEILKSMIE